MATTFDIDSILADVARTVNVPAFSTDTSISLSQITYKLVQSARSLSALFRQKFGEDRDFINQATLTVQAGVGLASLPADCGEVHAVLWVRTASDWRLLQSAGIDDLEDGQLDTLLPWKEQRTPKYQIQGNVLVFLPGSSVAETIVVYYTTHLNLTDQTSFLSRLDADRFITLDLVAWALSALGRKEEAAFELQNLAALRADLFSPARTVDPNSVDTIRDTRKFGRRRARGWFDV